MRSKLKQIKNSSDLHAALGVSDERIEELIKITMNAFEKMKTKDEFLRFIWNNKEFSDADCVLLIFKYGIYVKHMQLKHMQLKNEALGDLARLFGGQKDG